ncbi:MAG: RDD family protein [bacterium]|nr:MAG: RDD family protein [bacterium]
MTNSFIEDTPADPEPGAAPGLPEPENRELPGIGYAGFLCRFTALGIDLAIIAIFFYITSAAASFSYRLAYSVDLNSGFFFILFSILFYHLIAFVYFVFFVADIGQTPGKMALGIKVVRQTGQEAGVMRSLFRASGYHVSSIFFMVGFLWALMDRRHQTWHDKLAGTVVLDI